MVVTRQRDGANNLSAETDAALKAMGGITVGGLNTLSSAFGGAANFTGSATFAADGEDASIGAFFLNRGGTLLPGSVGRPNQFALYSSDRETAFSAYTLDVARATRAAIDAMKEQQP